MHVMSTAPVLTTARLTLRGHRADDLAACFALWGDLAVTRFILGRASTREETWSRLLRYVGHWTLLGFGYWFVEETATGRMVGEVGLADFQRALEPSFGGDPEIGWALQRWAHGQGFAREAVAAVLAWSDLHLAGRATACMIDPGNTASLRIAEHFGYRELARTEYHGAPTILFRRPATVGR